MIACAIHRDSLGLSWRFTRAMLGNRRPTRHARADAAPTAERSAGRLLPVAGGLQNGSLGMVQRR